MDHSNEAPENTLLSEPEPELFELEPTENEEEHTELEQTETEQTESDSTDAEQAEADPTEPVDTELIDYDPVAEANIWDPDDSASDFYEDSDDSVPGDIEIQVSLGAEEGTIGDVHIRSTTGNRPAVRISPNRILHLLGAGGLRRLLAASPGAVPDDDDDDVFGGINRYRRQPRRPLGVKQDPPPVPSPEGQILMASGDFGTNETYQETLRNRNTSLSSRIMERELDSGPDVSRRTTLLTQGMIPASQADTIINYDQRCYSGQFSDDGNFFFSCSQDFVVRMYDTSNPYNWRHYKSVEYPYPQWTITDATLSPDNKHLAYTSIRSMVCLAPTDPNDESEPHHLEFANMVDGPAHGGWGTTGFGIWSIRFSGDGRELVAGTGNDSVYVYDIEKNKSVLRIQGHKDDVNAVCYGDKLSPHILYSGSDDTLIKVWDRRSMRDNRAAGVFVGHTEGLTYVDSKGDGRYVLSNGKDQTMKLWDLRKMVSTEDAENIDPAQYTRGFDYRFMTFPDDEYYAHPHDCSVVTFRGHSVLKTLIRCHFSPPGSTNSRYVYTGSEDGKVHVYNMDATSAAKIDVYDSTKDSRPHHASSHSRLYVDRTDTQTWKTCVRDASWHPFAPMIAATAWNGWGGSTGTCTVHSWHDGPAEDESDVPLGRHVDCRMQEMREGEASASGGLRSQRVRRAGNDLDDCDGH